ncbi:MAG TPA: ABC transporter permease [Clostridia bacterium]|nr:ABC transporter permease [Clostridia bacterium]
MARAEVAADQLDANVNAEAAAEAAALELPPGIVAQTLGEYLRGSFARIKSGQSGVLPVILGLLIITAIFGAISPRNVFLSPGNIVNLFQQSAVFMVLAMAEGFALLLGEIDLSVGYVGAVGGVIAVQLVQPTTTHWPWWAAIVAALLCCALIGALQGSLITVLRLPSFVVTLSGLLIFNGVMLILLLLGPFSGILSLVGQGPDLQVLYNLMWGTIDPVVSWIAMAVVVAVLALILWLGDSRRRRSGLVAPPASLTIIKIAMIAAVGIVVVAICDINRANTGTLEGVPYVIPIVLAVLGAWTVLLQQTKFGRYVYAIGGNPEAARRAGINLRSVRTWAFVLCSFTAGIAGLLYASLLSGVSNNFSGGQYVLYAVAAAVIGGTSLFGGRGKPLHGVLGGLVIGAIYNGMYLMDYPVQWEFIVTGVVLMLAVTIDSLSRRGATSGSVARV